MKIKIKLQTELSKKERYETLIPQLKALFNGETDFIANLSNLMSALKSSMNLFWVGCYFVKGDELVLGPFQGPVACTRIKKGKGVCGACWERKQTIIVPDVKGFPGHITCNHQVKSEIVVPCLVEGEVIWVLDIDCDTYSAFDETDKFYLEEIVKLIKC